MTNSAFKITRPSRPRHSQAPGSSSAIIHASTQIVRESNFHIITVEVRVAAGLEGSVVGAVGTVVGAGYVALNGVGACGCARGGDVAGFD